jgi:murein DD-endopeptidase MepM/ murein hydrolase activator NlpD
VIVPALGPVVLGDKSLLDHDLTHATSGLPLYPAFDTGWKDGSRVLAPENVTVTRHSGGSFAGWSVYATGASGLRYFITHLRSGRAAVGAKVNAGGLLGTVGDFVGARVPHAHVGVNAEALLGPGKQFLHNVNYTHGQPTIRQQLAALAPPPKEVEIVEPWVPTFVNWYLFDRSPATRPSSAPQQIPQRVWDVIALAAKYRAEKECPPDQSAALQRKIEAARQALA